MGERILEVLGRTDLGVVDRHLRSVDWSFGDRGKGHPLEIVHPYPAKFIPEIPRTLLACLPVRAGTMVLDPFCGSGTTLTEAQRRGLPSLGIDLNPIACLISRVKTATTPPRLQRAAVEVISAARSDRDPERCTIPNVDHWFKPEVQEAIAALVHAIGAVSACAEAVDALRLALSSILVRVSNQESDTRYAAIEKSVTKADVFRYFAAACTKISKALLARDWQLLPSLVIEGDTLEVAPGRIPARVGIVITSPPYPNAYEYWLYHKYRMWWLGFDPVAVKAREIGARAHFFKKEHHTEGDFWSQMREAFRLIDAVLVESGFVCFVVGRSKIHGRIINNAAIIQAVAEERGMSLVSHLERTISAHRKSFNLSHANIKTETIVVFQKA